MEIYNGVKVYKCDPSKNKECDKKYCQKICFHTTRKEYSAEKNIVKCTTVGIVAGSEECNYCLLRKKCGALKYANSE